MRKLYIGLLFGIVGVVPLNAMKRLAPDNTQLIVTQKKSRQEVAKNSLVELFGLDKNLADAQLQHITDVNISPRIIPCGWCVPQANLNFNGRRYYKARFTHKDDKIITFHQGSYRLKESYASVWSAHDGSLLSHCNLALCEALKDRPENPPFNSFPQLRPDTNELFFVDRVGTLICWNIDQNVFRYTTEPLGRRCRSVWSKDKKKVIIVHSADGGGNEATILDTTTGCKEKTLASDVALFEQVGFIKDSHKAIVFLENVDSYQDDESVEYKKLPFQELLDKKGTEYRYFGKENKLIATLFNMSTKNIAVNIFDVENNSIKTMNYSCKSGSYPYIFIKDSTKLIVEYHHSSLDDNFIYEFPLHNHVIDIWDLESEQNIFTINYGALLCSFKQLNNKKNRLFIQNVHEVSLWDVRSQALIAKVDNIKDVVDAQLKKQGDKFIILAGDYAQVWEPSALTFKQIVLRKLLNFYWQTSRPFLSINSPKKLLDAVVQKFQHSGRIATRTREGLPAFCLDRNELQVIWDSFSEPLRAILWQSMKKKIERYGK